MRTFPIVALVLCLPQWPLVLFAQSRGPSAGRPASTVMAPEEIEQLINELAAKSPEPKQGSSELSVYEAQIWKAVDALHEQGARAFPQLVGHFDDARFCCCEDSLSSDDVYHLSVGDVCRRIIKLQVKKFVPWTVSDPRGTPGHSRSIVPASKKDAERWLESVRNKALWELQVDNVQSVIEENRERLKSETDAQRRKLCEEAIEANEKLAAQIKKAKSPVTTEPFRPYIGR